MPRRGVNALLGVLMPEAHHESVQDVARAIWVWLLLRPFNYSHGFQEGLDYGPNPSDYVNTTMHDVGGSLPAPGSAFLI